LFIFNPMIAGSGSAIRLVRAIQPGPDLTRRQENPPNVPRNIVRGSGNEIRKTLNFPASEAGQPRLEPAPRGASCLSSRVLIGSGKQIHHWFGQGNPSWLSTRRTDCGTI
jgi:hypothetical protein